MADNLLDKASILLTPTAYNDGSMLSIKPENGDGDFDFQRNSAATRVNAQGLVENVQIISSELVSNGDFSNGSTDWNLDSNWSIGNDKAIADGTGGYIKQTNVGGAGVTSIYKVQWTQNITAGTRLRFFARNYNDGGTITTLSITRDDGVIVFGGNCVGSGTFTAYVSSTNGYSFKMLAENGVEADITNVSAIEFDEDTNLPRIDYTDGCGSWLLEPQSTNLITYSEDFSGWTNIFSTDSFGSISPSGILNATTVTDDGNGGSSGNVRVQLNGVSVSASTEYTFSCFLKPNPNNIIEFKTANDNISVGGNWDLSTQVFTPYNSETGSVELISGGWYRASITWTTGTDTNIALRVGFPTITRDGSNSFDIWGAQLEEQSFPTSYIPTDGATNTRLQDIANNSGNSSLINSEEGTLYAEVSALADDGTIKIISLSEDANVSNRINIFYTSGSNKMKFVVRVNDSNAFIDTITLSNILDYNKVALKYKANDFAIWINGTKESEQLSGSTYPSNTLDKLNFDQGSGNYNFYGKTKALAVYKEALTDAELQALTTI